MRLAEFIRHNQEPIIQEWVDFAQTLVPGLDVAQLRDSAGPLLSFIADDIQAAQTTSQQVEKSHGARDHRAEPEFSSAAQTHGAGRYGVGFNVSQMVAEYRALRSSVIKLWRIEQPAPTDADVTDLIRFNEAVDQALAESLTRFMAQVDYSRDLLFSVLGHDIRSPLAAIKMASAILAMAENLNEKQALLLSMMKASSSRAIHIVEDLLDFTRAHLGAKLPILKAPMEMGALAQQVVGEIQIQHPRKTLHLEITGNLEGEWDAARLGQLLSNLVGNAVQYSYENGPIHIRLSGDDSQVVVSIHNDCEPIPPPRLAAIFDSFTRGQEGGNDDKAHMGLGLFITKEIALSHGGTIDVTSNADGTTFIVQLPKKPVPAPVDLSP